MQSPSVEYRGIFINDEDWGLTPWSWQTYEPSDVKGQIGPKTHERIFELLLRLRANTFWPAMHGCSVPFYFTPCNLLYTLLPKGQDMSTVVNIVILSHSIPFPLTFLFYTGQQRSG